MLTLGIDTSSHLCAAAIHDDASNEIVGETVEDIGKGHAERLMDVIAATLKAAGAGHRDIGRIAASAGPGSFTGIRAGLATARGLALARAIPAVGVNVLDALAVYAFSLAPGRDAPLLVVLDARRGEVFAQYHADGAAPTAPFVASPVGAANLVPQAIVGRLLLCGSGADAVLACLPTGARVLHRLHAPQIGEIARIGASLDIVAHPPEPLYLRPAGATPQTGFAVARA